jgi:hypothetical protein
MLRDIGEIQKLATKYSKQQLARMAQMGLIDPTKAVMAGMMIDRITKSNMQPPQTTVADEALMPMQPPAAPPMQQAQPPVAPSGISALPTQPEPNAGVAALPSGITEMAGGGIVAFDDGGAVPGYAGDRGSLVYGGSFEDLPVYVPRERPALQPAGSMGEVFSNLGSAIANPVVDFFSNAPDMNRAARQMVGKPDQGGPRADPVTGEPLSLGEFLRRQEAERGAVTPATAPAQTGIATQADVRRVDNALNPFAAPAPKPEGRAQVPAARRQVSAQTGMQEAPTGLQSIPRVADLTVPQGLGSFTTEAIPIPNKRELKDSLKEREQADRLAGVNTDIYKDLMKDLEGKKGKLAERKQEAIGTALMQTGLGLIGARRGQEFAALGESGQRALQGLVNANEKIRDTEDKIDDSRRGLLMAENDYKRNRSDKAFDDVQRERDKIQALEIKNIENRNAAAKSQAEIGVQLFGQQVNLQGQKVLERGQDIQRQTSLDTARIHAAAGNRPGESERLMSQYENIQKTQGQDAANAWLSNLERVRGAGKPQNTFSYEEALKIVAAQTGNIRATPQELARQARELMAASNPQQTGGGTLQRGADGTFTYQPPR